jgi:CubicO group peptidase (beta-lactamase class C family)
VTAALAQVAGWPARAAAGVVDAGGVLAQTGPVGEEFGWASVTKMVTAMAVLVAVEEELIGLDDPAGPPGATIRHLLAHASGLPFEGQRPVSKPGKRRIYSNRGFEILARVVAEAAGMDFAGYMTAGVLEPVGMASTRLAGSPAWGLRGPLTDLLRLGRELLAPRVLAPETLALARSVSFPGLTGVVQGFGRQPANDWGLGFEIRDGKHPHWTGQANSPDTFGHFGRWGSFLWVDPAAGVACASLADRDFGPWAAKAWPALADAVVAEFGASRRAPPP